MTNNTGCKAGRSHGRLDLTYGNARNKKLPNIRLHGYRRSKISEDGLQKYPFFAIATI